MRKSPVVFVFLACLSLSRAAYLGIGQYGFELGRVWPLGEARMTASVGGLYFSGVSGHHFEMTENIRLWYLREIHRREAIRLKLGFSALCSPVQVREEGRYDSDYSWGASPLAYEVEAMISESLSLTAVENLLEIRFDRNGWDLRDMKIGELIPKFGIRYSF